MAATSMSTLQSHAFELPNQTVLRTRLERFSLHKTDDQTYMGVCAVSLVKSIRMSSIRGIICFGVVIDTQVLAGCT
jgi:hypothetical protein